MATSTPAAADAFLLDLRAAQETARTAIVLSGVRSADSTWAKWQQFCASLDVDPMLQDISDPVQLLQVYGLRIRDGRLSKSGQPVRSGTVATALREVGQTIALLGSPDPRLATHGRIDIRLSRMSKAFAKQDPHPDRVKPIPLSLLLLASATAYAIAGSSISRQAIVDMMCLAFYFLMRPGEYCTTPNEPHPFRMRDVVLYAGGVPLSIATCTDAQLLSATSVELTFTTQKNSVRGEKIAHGRSGHAHFCPVLATARRLIHLRTHQATPETPLHTYRTIGSPSWIPVRADQITELLRCAVRTSPTATGFDPKNVTAKSLRSSGAMALLVAQVDTDLIRLIGRWKSDAMLRYLHIQALPVMQKHAATMLSHGNSFPRPSAL